MEIPLLETIKKKLAGTSDEKLSSIISDNLGLRPAQIQTVNFVFWLCYMAERDLKEVIDKSWEATLDLAVKYEISTEGVEEKVKEMGFNFNKLDYFREKIEMIENLYGKNTRVKLLWKLNNIRNDISHNRIDDLTYNNEKLELRATKEKILLDYLESHFHFDFEGSEMWKNLPDNQKDLVNTMFNDFINRHSK